MYCFFSLEVKNVPLKFENKTRKSQPFGKINISKSNDEEHIIKVKRSSDDYRMFESPPKKHKIYISKSSSCKPSLKSKIKTYNPHKRQYLGEPRTPRVSNTVVKRSLSPFSRACNTPSTSNTPSTLIKDSRDRPSAYSFSPSVFATPKMRTCSSNTQTHHLTTPQINVYSDETVNRHLLCGSNKKNYVCMITHAGFELRMRRSRN